MNQRISIQLTFCFFVMMMALVSIAISEEVALETPQGMIKGTLEVPSTCDVAPVVLIIAGSGPTDRDGNSILLPGKNNSLKQLAEKLLENNIASLRYDKRGVAKSLKVKEESLLFEDYIEDAVSWCKMLRADKRFSYVIVLGHSEGSLIGMVAAARANADGYISVAGAGRPIDRILIEQLYPQLPDDLMKESLEIMIKLKKGEQTKTVSKKLYGLFRPSVQPYMISWMKYEPAEEIKKLKCPILILQGTKDIQIKEKDAKLLGESIQQDPIIIEGMNHVLKIVTNDYEQAASYTSSSFVIAPDLIVNIVNFVQKVGPKTKEKIPH